MNKAEIFWLNGPVLKARPVGTLQIKEAVFVGEQRLAGEVIRLDAESVTVQVFEDTTGLRPGSPIVGSGLPLAAELGPGLLGCMFDGIQRPLVDIARRAGDYFDSGVNVTALDRERRWSFQPSLEVGAEVSAGQTLGLVPESANMSHRVLVPEYLHGTLEWIAEAGEHAVEETVAVVRTRDGLEDVAMLRRWPIRRTRPYAARLPLEAPLLTGQRAIDTFFPIAKGGAASMPGGFGTGKTVLLQTVAKWSDADVIVYIGCGERGNEMADVLDEFPLIEDPRTGRKLMERTVLIANTSNMPVAAREASIYTGITIAEYFRDQGFHVALFADSISRWAEALREISGRLEELPAEEGYPAYLPTRLAEFFERSGRVQTLDGDEASLTVVGTVSPPGGDFSEPVTAHTRRYVKSFLALDRARAQARFYPAIHPLQSYSGYLEQTQRWWAQRGALQRGAFTKRLLELLEEQARLEKMVKIVGRDALPASQRLVLVCADVIVEALLRQSAFSEKDRFCSAEKQAEMLKVIDLFLQQAERAVESGIDPDRLMALPITRRIQRMGEDIGGDELEGFATLLRDIHDVFGELTSSFAAGGEAS